MSVNISCEFILLEPGVNISAAYSEMSIAISSSPLQSLWINSNKPNLLGTVCSKHVLVICDRFPVAIEVTFLFTFTTLAPKLSFSVWTCLCAMYLTTYVGITFHVWRHCLAQNHTVPCDDFHCTKRGSQVMSLEQKKDKRVPQVKCLSMAPVCLLQLHLCLLQKELDSCNFMSRFSFNWWSWRCHIGETETDINELDYWLSAHVVCMQYVCKLILLLTQSSYGHITN